MTTTPPPTAAQPSGTATPQVFRDAMAVARSGPDKCVTLSSALQLHAPDPLGPAKRYPTSHPG
jgi:hypothetical protein